METIPSLAPSTPARSQLRPSSVWRSSLCRCIEGFSGCMNRHDAFVRHYAAALICRAEWRCAPDWGTLEVKTIALPAPLSRLERRRTSRSTNTVLRYFAYAAVAIVDRVVGSLEPRSRGGARRRSGIGALEERERAGAPRALQATAHG